MKTRLAAFFILLLFAIACSSQKPEKAPPPTPEKPEASSPHGPSMGGKKEVFLPEKIKSAWKGVTIQVTDKKTNETKNYDVPLNSEFSIPGSNITIKVGDFFPSFVIEGGKMTSSSNETENPATNVEIREGSKIIFSGWLFARYPDVHPFEHDRYRIVLLKGIPAEK
ncbi:MAG: DUF2155 domain-containing protein [Deltaproteobacteria bacterium]|nr:MAG: DUF2155 domain-containing protein [Deltaproteobacteria bacterium]